MYKVMWNGKIAIIDTSIKHWSGGNTIAYGYSNMEKKLSLTVIMNPVTRKIEEYLNGYDAMCLASFIVQRPGVKLTSAIRCYGTQKNEWKITNSNYGYAVDLEGQRSPYILDTRGIVVYGYSRRPGDYKTLQCDLDHPRYVAIARAIKLLGGVL